MGDTLEMVPDQHHLQWADSCAITLLEEQPIPEVETGTVSLSWTARGWSDQGPHVRGRATTL
jgi:hypothetical protein